MAWAFQLSETLTGGSISWDDDVLSVDVRYGATTADAPQGGHMTIVLDNSSNKFTPGGGGDHTAETWLGQRIRLRENDGGFAYGARGNPVIFDGLVSDVDFTIFSQFEAYVTVTVSDRLGLIMASGFNIGPDGIEDPKTYATVEAWLDELVSWYAFGSLPVQTTVNVTGGSTTATDTGITFVGAGGDVIAALSRTEGGIITNRQGRSPTAHTSTTPNEVWVRPRTEEALAVEVTFDDTGAANTFLFESIDIAYLGTDLTTRVILQQLPSEDEPTPPVVYDGTTSQSALVGDRVLEWRNLYNATLDNVKQLAAHLVGTRSQPHLSITSLTTLKLFEGEDDDDRDLLSLSTLERVRVKFTPPGGSTQLDLTHTIRGVRWKITPAYAQLTLDLVDTETNSGFIIDTDLIDTGTIT